MRARGRLGVAVAGLAALGVVGQDTADAFTGTSPVRRYRDPVVKYFSAPGLAPRARRAARAINRAKLGFALVRTGVRSKANITILYSPNHCCGQTGELGLGGGAG
jgi:hypothetical protein